jgi:hypothetical protein
VACGEVGLAVRIRRWIAADAVFGRARAGGRDATCHWPRLSRILLGHCLGITAGDVRFEHSAKGKPSLATNLRQTPLNFNFSHSGDFVLVALACDRDLGIDIERIRTDIDATELPRGAPGPTNKANAGEKGPLCQRHRPRAPVGLGRRGIGWRRGRAHRHRPSPAPAGPARPGTGPSPAPRSRSRSWLVASAVGLVRSREDFAGIWRERGRRRLNDVCAAPGTLRATP